MNIAIIAAMDRNHLIGNEGKIPWLGELPADLKHFRDLTMGHPVIMGRKTYESVGKPLEGRTNIVLSGGHSHLQKGILPARNQSEAILFAQGAPGSEIIFVIGGAAVYEQFLGKAKTLLLTIVEGAFSGDAYFPEYSEREWMITSDRRFEADGRNKYPYSFLTVDRI